MGVISNNLLEQLTDRMAKQADEIRSGLQDANHEGGGYYYYRIHSGVGLSGDSDVEEDLIASAADLDEDFEPNDTYRLIMNDFVNALDVHVRNQGAAGLNAFLTTSGINVAELFADVFNACKGQRLDAINVFDPNEEVMATIHMSSSGTGTWDDGVAIGTGSGSYSTTNHAAARLFMEIAEQDLSNNAEVKLCLTKEDGSSEEKTVDLSSGLIVGERANVGSASDAYLDVSSLIWAGGTSGTDVIVKNHIERTIAL